MLDDGRQVDIHVGKSERADDVPEVALSKPLVVRLGEDLRSQQFVRDLGVRSPFERVVNDIAERFPAEELHARSRRGLAQLFEHVIVPLGSMKMTPEPRLMAASANRSIKDRLAGAGRPDDQRHNRPDARDRHPDQVAPPGEADRDPVVR